MKPNGKARYKRVKALIETGSERNYLELVLLKGWLLPMIGSHPVQLACEGKMLESIQLKSPLHFTSGKAHFTSPFFCAEQFEFLSYPRSGLVEKVCPNHQYVIKGFLSCLF